MLMDLLGSGHLAHISNLKLVKGSDLEASWKSQKAPVYVANEKRKQIILQKKDFGLNC